MPPTVQVVAERARAYLPEAVLFGDVFGFEDNVFQGTRVEVRGTRLEVVSKFKGLRFAIEIVFFYRKGAMTQSYYFLPQRR